MAKLTRGVKSSVSRKYVKSLMDYLGGIGEVMKRVIAYFVSGMRTGSFFYLCLVLLSHVYPNIVYPAVNVRNILAIFLMSGTMGS